MDQLINYFLPSKSLSKRLDLFELRKRKLFISFCLIALFSIVVFTISHFLGGKIYSGAINVAGAIIMLGSLLLYKFSGYYSLAASGFLISAVLVAGGQHYLAPSHMQSNLMWFPLIALLSYFILKKEHAVLMLFICGGIGLGSHIGPEFYPISGDQFNMADRYAVNILTIILSIVVGHVGGRYISKEETDTLKELEKKNQDLLELSESNAALLSILSHDLANHIHVAYGFGKKLDSCDLEDVEAIRCHSKVMNSVEQMKTIVDGVRGYTATKSGKINIHLSPVLIRESVNKSIDLLQKHADEKEVKINLVTDFEEDISISCEPISLVNSVMNNLLTNAIKFSHPHSEIRICITDLDDSVSFSIRDTGMGIPDDILKNIFDPSISTSRSGTVGEPGTGFGLPILKMFIDKYDAHIDVSSSIKGETGTEFRIHFKKWETVAKR